MRTPKNNTIPSVVPKQTNYIDAYLDYRTRSGEKLSKDAYLIREQFDVTDLEQVRKQGRPINKKTLSNNLISIVGRSGLRKVNHNFTKRRGTRSGCTWI